MAMPTPRLDSPTTVGLSTAQLVGFLHEDPSDAALAVFERRGFAEHQTPAHALAFAVLQDTIDGLLKTPLNRRKFLHYQEDLQWLLSEDEQPLYAFARICRYFDIDADKVRNGICRILNDIAAGTRSVPSVRRRRRTLYVRRSNRTA